MAYGAEFYNDSGKVQISSDVSNFYMVQKGSLTSASSPATITPTVPYDCIAVGMSITNPNNRMRPLSMFPTTQAANTSKTVETTNFAAFTLYWYAFASYRNLAPATSGYGMEIYNTDGSVGFSSLYPKILKGYKIPVTGDYGTLGSLDASKTYAFMQYGTIIGPSSSNFMGFKWQRYPSIGQSNSTTATMTWTEQSLGYSPYNGPGFNGGFIVLDVTNY